MNLFKTNPKLIRENKFNSEFMQGKYTFKLFSSCFKDQSDTYEPLCQLTRIFHQQLPKMPREYIIRQVFDAKHRCLALYRDTLIGGICYRPFSESGFYEIVFCAIDAGNQVMGCGSFLMDCFKEHVKREMNENIYATNKVEETLGIRIVPNHIVINPEVYLSSIYAPKKVYLITYADNYAIGYFKKQEFRQKELFSSWKGRIKDYDGGTLMQCKLCYHFNYFKKQEFVESLRLFVMEEMAKKMEFSVIHEPKDKIVRNKTPKDEYLLNAINYMYMELETHPSAWPFLKPVDKKEVPDYYKIIKNPMDLSKIEDKINKNEYTNISQFIDDFQLMINNCCFYNGKATVYYKCAKSLEDFFKLRIKPIQDKFKNELL
ncbi:Histone acetyltransferase GCN5 [Astathelohania contejeani]|uniref:histone acetyltransferase n=1 Tax=Astathelohania contejeani TaxID=164912 RepID=A0ABQ7I1V7_9MICR|nr:Histone acetyltransferase GCN5 [Thelohania contejeani]